MLSSLADSIARDSVQKHANLYKSFGTFASLHDVEFAQPFCY